MKKRTHRWRWRIDKDDRYVEIAHEDDEFGYYVKCSHSDETIYYCEYEWMHEPIPYASDIRHYIALRYQGQSRTR